MPETLVLMSRLPMAVTLSEPMPEEFAEKPGLAPALKRLSVVPGVNRDVDAETYQKWKAEAEKSQSPLLSLIEEVSEEDASKPDPTSYGFEPGMKKLAEDAEAKEAATKGSTVKTEGPAKASDVTATSNTPNDDSPRGEPAISQAQAASQTATPATAKVAPASK